MEKKNTVLLTVIAVATLLVAVVGATFAYFSATVTNINNTQTVIESAQLGITFDGTQEINATGENAIEPGWSATKTFTVENTSAYDMTFDVNITNVVNNFSRPQDLTYSLTGTYVQGSNNQTQSGNVQMLQDSTATAVASSTKVALAVTNVQVPTGGSLNTSTTPATPVPSTDVTKVARVFIPAGAKISFSMPFSYAYLAETDQNADQGKYFQATVYVTANGIDAPAAS